LLVQFSNVALYTPFKSNTRALLHQHTRGAPDSFLPSSSRFVFAACPPTEGTKYNSHYRKFASYNDYVLVHLYTVVQFSSGSGFGSCVQFWVCARRRSSSSSWFSRRRRRRLVNTCFYEDSRFSLRILPFFLVVQRRERVENNKRSSARMPIAHFTRAPFRSPQTNPGK
jgi:hypothetical protein